MTPLLAPSGGAAAAVAAARSGADAVLLDIGEPAAPGGRAALRRAAAEGAEGLRRAGRRALVRVAPLASGLTDGDLDAVLAGAPSAVLLPGAVGGRDLQHLAAKLAVREAERGLAAGSTGIAAAAADTPAGVLALPSLRGTTPRLVALAWDPAALAAALGVAAEASPVRTARDLLVVAAAAAGVPAIDMGAAPGDLLAACRAARRNGFAGRLARRAGEVSIIAAAFA